MRDTDDIRSSIIDFWKAVLLAVVAFAVIVVYVFVSCALDWKHEQERLELLAKQKAVEKVGKITAVAFVNTWNMADVGILGVDQKRTAEPLNIGEEYYVGALRYYDTSDGAVFDHVLEVTPDDPTFTNPVITVGYSKYIHVKYSIDGGDGSYLISGETDVGDKTGERLYTIVTDGEVYNDPLDGAWGEGVMTFTIPINGLNGLEVNIDSEDISEDMRQYNYIVTERLGDVYSDAPSEYADRIRKVYTSHVIVEGWKSDPRERRDGKSLAPTPEVSVLIRIKHYGEWDLTADEFDLLKFKISEFSNINNRKFSPYTTIEYVGNLK